MKQALRTAWCWLFHRSYWWQFEYIQRDMFGVPWKVEHGVECHKCNRTVASVVDWEAGYDN